MDPIDIVSYVIIGLLALTVIYFFFPAVSRPVVLVGGPVLGVTVFALKLAAIIYLIRSHAVNDPDASNLKLAFVGLAVILVGSIQVERP